MKRIDSELWLKKAIENPENVGAQDNDATQIEEDKAELVAYQEELLEELTEAAEDNPNVSKAQFRVHAAIGAAMVRALARNAGMSVKDFIKQHGPAVKRASVRDVGFAQRETSRELSGEEKLKIEEARWAEYIDELKDKREKSAVFMLNDTPLIMRLLGAKRLKVMVRAHLFDGVAIR